MSDQDLFDHGQRIAQLERKVAELYRRLGQSEPEFGGGFDAGAETGFRDDVGEVDDPRVLELLREGKQIQAIKLYRELTGLGLKEAKDAVDRLSNLQQPGG